MKKKFLTMFSIMFVLAFAVVVYAYNQTTISAETKTANGTKMDSCPLKNKNASTAENQTGTSCCDNENCCCKTGACPMKVKGENNASANDCCGSCCGGSCPMKNKDAQATTMQVSDDSVANGESCRHKNAGA